MLIRQTRIANLTMHLGPVARGTEVVVGLLRPERFTGILARAGLGSDLKNGQSVLPAPDFGPVSRHNAHGKNRVRRDLPMETAYRTVEWHWTEWHGRDRVEQSDFRDVPYQRYPREFMPPPSVQISVGTQQGLKVVYSPAVAYTQENVPRLLHTINLYLEMFGECAILAENLEAIIRLPLVNLNWKVLPPGRRPWEQLRQEVEPLVRRARGGNQPVIWHRLGVINQLGPGFLALGEGGFRGYVVFGFPEKELFICESISTGNATYVFGQDWETLSKMTKAEILDNSLQKERIIHRVDWDRDIRRLLQS